MGCFADLDAILRVDDWCLIEPLLLITQSR